MKKSNKVFITMLFMVMTNLSFMVPIKAAVTFVSQKRLYQNLNNLSDPADDSGASRQEIVYFDPATNTVYVRLDAYDTTTGAAIAVAGLPSRFPTFEESAGLTPVAPTLTSITIPGVGNYWGFIATVAPHTSVYWSIISSVTLQYGPDSFADRSTRIRTAIVADVDIPPVIVSPLSVPSLLVSDVKTQYPILGQIFASNVTWEITSDTALNSSTYPIRVSVVPIADTSSLTSGVTYYTTVNTLSAATRSPFTVVFVPVVTPPPGPSSSGGVGINTTNPLSTLDVNGTLSLKTVVLIGTSSPVTIDDGIYVSINPQGTNQEFQLPNATTYPGRIYLIRNISNSNTAKLITSGGLLFPKNSTTGSTEIYMYENNFRTIIVISDGLNWTYID